MAFLGSRMVPPNRVMAVCIAGLMLAIAGQAQGQTVFKCKNAAGNVAFSDRKCFDAKLLKPLEFPQESDAPERKTEQDARVSRDKALADQLEASRLAREQAARAAQDQQMVVNRSISDKFEQERKQKNAAVVSSPRVTELAPTSAGQ